MIVAVFIEAVECEAYFCVGAEQVLLCAGLHIAALDVNIVACNIVNAGDSSGFSGINQEVRNRITCNTVITGVELQEPAVQTFLVVLASRVEVICAEFHNREFNRIFGYVSGLGLKRISVDSVTCLEVVAVGALIKGLNSPRPCAVCRHSGGFGVAAYGQSRVELAI